MAFDELVLYALGFIMIYAGVFNLLLLVKNAQKISRKPVAKRFPKTSVLIPAYNEEKTIHKTIESVLALEYPKGKLEVIVINDGSTDDTSRIAKEFIRKKTRFPVRVLNKPNKGKANALNFGLKHARGEIIVSLDADSYVEPDALKQMIGYLNDPKVMVVTSVMKVFKPKNLLEHIQRVEYLVMVFLRKVFSYINAISVVPGPFSVYRKKVFDEVGEFDEKSLVEDQEMAFRIQSANYKIECSMDAIVHTVPPKTLKQLVKQRVRWQRGTMRNIYKYRKLIKPSYGDFGLFAIPIGIFFALYFALVLLLGIKILVFSPEIAVGLPAYIVSTISMAFSNPLFLFAEKAILIPWIIILLVVAWALLSLKYTRGERVTTIPIVLYVVVYFILSSVFWTATYAAELMRLKTRWGSTK